MKIYKFNKFNFLNENYSDFNQYQSWSEPFPNMPGYGFAVDNQVSIQGDRNSPLMNQYYKTPFMVNTLFGILKNINKDQAPNNYTTLKFDYFLEDLEDYDKLKILKIIDNNLYLDVFISFEFKNEEYFGVYKSFNSPNRKELKSELFTDSNYRYIDNEYILKLDNWFYNIINNWFKPKEGEYMNLKPEMPYKNDIGDIEYLKEKAIIEVLGVYKDNNNKYYIAFEYKNNKYYIINNNYYYFNYWFEKIEK